MPTSLPRTIAEASRLIAARSLSPLELTQALIRRGETIEPLISSFITVMGDAEPANVFSLGRVECR